MRARRHSRGFTLIEVLVAMLIVAVGMLGIAKMQAMSYASTGTASYRSLAAIEAASLAAAMRANRNYWTGAPGTGLSSTGVTTFTVTHASPLPTATSSDGNVAITPTIAVPPGCAGTVSRSSFAIAACDLSGWAGAINSVLPVVNATVTCAPPAAVNTVTQPIGCTIVLSWTENQTGINSQSQQGGQVAVPSVNGAATTQTNYTLYVEP